jgi:hypothetical protein
MAAILLALLLGIIGSVIAAYTYDIIRDKMTARKIDIQGTWGEFIKDSSGRQYSVGRIYRDRKKRRYAFDGTNFLNNGSAYCHWTTINSHIDLEQGQFFYTFRAQVEDEPEKQYY